QTRVPSLVAALSHLAVDLRGQHDLVAPAPQRPADDLLGLAARIHVGGVDDVDPALDRLVDHADTGLDVGVAPGAEHHRPEAMRAHGDPGGAERSVFHGKCPLSLARSPQATGEGPTPRAGPSPTRQRLPPLSPRS